MAEPKDPHKPRRGLSEIEEKQRALRMHKRIVAAMQREGVTEEWVIAKAGVHHDFLRNIERGKSLNPSFFTIIAIAEFLRVSPFWLAQMTDEPKGFSLPRRARESSVK